MQSISSEPDCTSRSDDAIQIPVLPTDLPEELRTLALSWFDPVDSAEKVTVPKTGYRGIDPSILKDYPLPSPEERQKFEKSNDIAYLRAKRVYGYRNALHLQTTFPDDDSHARRVSELKAKITESEEELKVMWIVDETMKDGGFYRSMEGEEKDYKDFYGRPGAGGSGAPPCMFDPELWDMYCGNIPEALLRFKESSTQVEEAQPSLESA